MNPTGHAAVYFNHICADSPTVLRPCHDGEYGVVISRYHKIDGYDWIAIPLVAYLYAVDSPSDIPPTVDKEKVAALRDAYRREHLLDLAPDNRHGESPKGEWTELVGSSYDRTIHGFQVDSTPAQDQRFIATFNDRRNVGHFNLLFHNCADFSRVVLDIYLPHAIHRNFIADIGLMTPKQVARSLVGYGKKNPELNMTAFVIPQVPGSIPRSHPVDGVAESLVKSKKYLLPMVVSGARGHRRSRRGLPRRRPHEAAQEHTGLRDRRRGNDQRATPDSRKVLPVPPPSRGPASSLCVRSRTAIHDFEHVFVISEESVRPKFLCLPALAFGAWIADHACKSGATNHRRVFLGGYAWRTLSG